MGFLITSEYQATSRIQKTNIYVNIRNFEISWNDSGDPIVRKYFVQTTYQTHYDAEDTTVLKSNNIRFECTKAETEGNIPALIYAFLRSNIFNGHTFQDVV